MGNEFHIVVCGSIVPDPLQTLAPQDTPQGPVLQNEMMLPAVLDPWAGHALYEAANLAKNNPGSQVWLVALGPKAKLQQGDDGRVPEGPVPAGGGRRLGLGLHRRL